MRSSISRLKRPRLEPAAEPAVEADGTRARTVAERVCERAFKMGQVENDRLERAPQCSELARSRSIDHAQEARVRSRSRRDHSESSSSVRLMTVNRQYWATANRTVSPTRNHVSTSTRILAILESISRSNGRLDCRERLRLGGACPRAPILRPVLDVSLEGFITSLLQRVSVVDRDELDAKVRWRGFP